MIGLERVEGIAHFPSDVLAGAVIGIVIAKLLSVKVFRSESSALCNNLSGSRKKFRAGEPLMIIREHYEGH